jgi:ring-1,2-phenylacetyl-CoA epoxidase subunit PaaA
MFEKATVGKEMSQPMTAVDPQEQALLERIHAGELIEDMQELTPRYRAILERTLEIAAQSEVTVLTWAYTAFRVAPDIGAKVAICGTIQDEVGHAHQQGMLFERFGFDMQKVAFEADPRKYWSLPIMEFPVRNYAEFVVSQAFLDRAGRFTTWDIELNCSFAPYRRTARCGRSSISIRTMRLKSWLKMPSAGSFPGVTTGTDVRTI